MHMIKKIFTYRFNFSNFGKSFKIRHFFNFIAVDKTSYFKSFSSKPMDGVPQVFESII